MKPIFAFLAALLLSPLALAQEKISLYYPGYRIPYYYSNGGRLPVGRTADPANAALAKAGIPFEWIEVPAARFMTDLKEQSVSACVPGFFKTPERESWAKISSAIYRDAPKHMLVRKDFDFKTTKFRELLERTDVTLLIKKSYSYGAALDKMLSDAKSPNEVVTSDATQMARMIASKRGDIMLVADFEGQPIIDGLGADGSNLKMVALSDMPAGELLYFICSRGVSDVNMAHLNKALGVVK
jgi:hypothetical protein